MGERPTRESGETNPARQEPPPEIGPPEVIVFELTTARRVGAQLRYNGGPQLDEVRYAVRMIMQRFDGAQ